MVFDWPGFDTQMSKILGIAIVVAFRHQELLNNQINGYAGKAWFSECSVNWDYVGSKIWSAKYV